MEEIKGGRAASPQQPPIIDRDSSQPVYIQVANHLYRQILAGIYSPGDKLPSEGEMVNIYDVSPMTIRRAINYLAAQDVIYTEKGSGTYVKAVELEDAAFYLRDLTQVFNDDVNTTVKVIEAKFVPADERIARKLRIGQGEKVIYIRRMLLARRLPAFYHRGYLVNDPTRPVVEAELQVTDLKGIFQGSGSELIKSGEVFLEAILLDEEESHLLQLSPSTPGMMLEHVFYDFDDKPLSWGWFVCASDRLRLHTWVGHEITTGIRDERTR
jgi:GntR family transcriptional regulator